MKTETVPVTLLTGFLGAGKTTYLNTLLTQGIAPGSLILVNDFGDINIDAELIDYQDENILRLSNGCICCTLGGTLAEQLAEILRTPPGPTSIYIEASGIANPARIVDTITVSPKLHLEALVCIVDVSQAERHARDPRTADVWRQQIQAANRLVVNRLGADEDMPAAIARLRDMADAADTAAKFERRGPSVRKLSMGLGRPGHAGRWQSRSFTFAQPIDGEWLERVMRQYADVLVRAKGILRRSGREGMDVFQLSGADIRWHPALRRNGKGQLVCIGSGGDRFSQLVQALEHAEDNAPEHPSADQV